MISSSAVYGDPVSIHMRFPMDTYQGQWQYPFSSMLRYFRAVLFSEKLLLQTFSK